MIEKVEYVWTSGSSPEWKDGSCDPQKRTDLAIDFLLIVHRGQQGIRNLKESPQISPYSTLPFA